MKIFIAVLTALFCGLVMWLLFMANTEQDTFIFKLMRSLPYGDKVAHVGIFGLLALLLNLSCGHRFYRIGGCPLLWGSSAVVLFATLEEASQYYLPSRTFDLLDYLASLCGIGVFSLLSYRKKLSF